ncbi:MAG: hypothetical protein HN396_11025 [Gemmatimonadales bacterium]|nr:hypothetical protein [Gemmatimonadales bacterium]MBT3498453.1 hypothetical protein [Gemmatimonadales bacterium]MBT3776400.1 hypothetical protein [Gemmatimonadales bacterium]MBT3959263.1 hypothetical protein [Gemmatimonadales bacterium]MBT4436561.1 hypothetical protein [Gemmatimonadales bacterium]
MGEDARVERLMDEIIEAEELAEPVSRSLRQDASWFLLAVGFFIGVYVDWQLLHPAFLVLYGLVGMIVFERYLTRSVSRKKVDQLLAQVDELGDRADDVS